MFRKGKRWSGLGMPNVLSFRKAVLGTPTEEKRCFLFDVNDARSRCVVRKRPRRDADER